MKMVYDNIIIRGGKMSSNKNNVIGKDLMKLLDDFTRYKIKIEGRTESSANIYYKHIKEFCETMGVYDLDTFVNVKAQTIKDWLIKLDEKKNTEATRNNKLSAIKQIFLYLEEELDLDVDRKISRIKYAKAPIKKSRYVKEENLLDLLDSASTQEMRAALMVLFGTGVRFSELLQITCTDIKNKGATIMGKGRKERKIWFSVPIIKECNDFIYGERKKIIERTGVDTDLLFISRNGRPIAQPVFLRSLKRTARRCGLYWADELSPHKFRHGYATAKISQGYSIAELRDSLGHSSIKTTDRYIHTDESAIRKMMTGEDNDDYI